MHDLHEYDLAHYSHADVQLPVVLLRKFPDLLYNLIGQEHTDVSKSVNYNECTPNNIYIIDH